MFSTNSAYHCNNIGEGLSGSSLSLVERRWFLVVCFRLSLSPLLGVPPYSKNVSLLLLLSVHEDNNKNLAKQAHNIIIMSTVVYYGAYII